MPTAKRSARTKTEARERQHTEKRNMKTERKPVMKIKTGKNSSTELYMLRIRQSMPSAVSSKRTIHGPCAVLLDIKPTGLRQDVLHIDAPELWEWLERLAQAGADALDGRN